MLHAQPENEAQLCVQVITDAAERMAAVCSC